MQSGNDSHLKEILFFEAQFKNASGKRAPALRSPHERGTPLSESPVGRSNPVRALGKIGAGKGI